MKLAIFSVVIIINNIKNINNIKMEAKTNARMSEQGKDRWIGGDGRTHFSNKVKEEIYKTSRQNDN